MDNDRQAPIDTGLWIKNRTKRYVEDDFALSLSPPSCEEGGYFSSQQAAQHTYHSKFSMYDRINQELNSVENSATLTGKESSCHSSNNVLASLSISSSGVYLKKNTPQSSEASKVVVPPTDNESTTPILLFSGSDEDDKEDLIESSISADTTEIKSSPKDKFDLKKSRSSSYILEAFGNISEAEQRKFDAPNDDVIAGTQSKWLSLSQQNLSSPESSPTHCQMADKQTDPWSVSKYFYTGKQIAGLTSHAGSVSAEINASLAAKAAMATSESAAKAPIASLELREKQLEEAAKIASNLQLPAKTGKRRPKQTALREMNFWAPQSM